MSPTRTAVLLHGFIAGLIGHVAIAGGYAILNVATGRSAFHTAALLGAPLVGGTLDPAAVQIAPGPILAFNGIHMAVLLAIGLAASWLVCEIELHPAAWYPLVIGGMLVALHGFGAVLALAVGAGPALPQWSVSAAALLAAVVMGAYLVLQHPRLLRSVDEADPDTHPGVEPA